MTKPDVTHNDNEWHVCIYDNRYREARYLYLVVDSHNPFKYRWVENPDDSEVFSFDDAGDYAIRLDGFLIGA